MTMERSCSQSISSGTTAAACAELGLEQMPTVLISGMQEELLVSFRAQNGAVDQAGFESKFLHGALHAVTGGLVQRGVADDAALAHLSFADLELRFDQYNHLAAIL